MPWLIFTLNFGAPLLIDIVVLKFSKQYFKIIFLFSSKNGDNLHQINVKSCSGRNYTNIIDLSFAELDQSVVSY